MPHRLGSARRSGRNGGGTGRFWGDLAGFGLPAPVSNIPAIQPNWQYSNKMRGQRRKRAEEVACESAAAAQQGCGALASAAIEIIEHRALKPRRIPSRSWRELIKKVWEVDPLLCPQCHHEMRIVSLINDAQTIERILRHVGPGGVDQWVDEVCNRHRAVA